MADDKLRVGVYTNTHGVHGEIKVFPTTDDVKRFKEVFRKRKDYYRRYRDLSFFILVGVYALSVIDAYVDASLSDFDISDDLSMHVGPTVLNSKERNLPFQSTGVGVRCALTF